MRQPAIYIVASKRDGTLYTGVTAVLVRRIWQHREGVTPGFASKHGCTRLVWFELADNMEAAIAREKKIALIEAANPEWRDLWPDIAHP